MTEPALTDFPLERSLVAIALHDFGKTMARGIVAEDFASAECRQVWELASHVYESGKAVTHGAIVAAAGTPERSRDLAPKLAAFRAEVPPDHERLRRLRQLRDMRAKCLHAASLAELGDMDGAMAALDEARTAAVARSEHDTVLTVDDLSGRFLTRLHDNATKRRVHMGMELFAKAVGPCVPGSMVVIGADTNVGKTGYALQLLSSTFAANGTKCGFISCEDPEDVVTPRLIAAHSRGLSSRELQTGEIHRDSVYQVNEALTNMSDALQGGMFFSFPIGGTDADVCGEMSRMVAKGCRVIGVDYIQTIEPSKKQQDRRNEIRWIASRLKGHANRLGVPLIILSQLTVPPGAPPGWEPTIGALKESKDLANASESVILLWRDDDFDGAAVTCKLGKSKIGNVGATWQVARDHNAVVREVADSYVTAQENYALRRKAAQERKSARRGFQS